ncbi:hypothetical protein ACX4M5_13565 [Roseomonas mucosa]
MGDDDMHESLIDLVAQGVWDTWTRCGLGMTDMERTETLDAAKEAVRATWSEGAEYTIWRATALERLGVIEA